MGIFASYGGAAFSKKSKKVIRLLRKGCTNRPFFHISVQEEPKTPNEPVIEQIGNYDPLPNNYNEKLVALNFERLEYWLKEGAKPTDPVKKLLGLCGYFPVHPISFTEAYLNRKRITQELEKLKIKAAEFSSVESEKIDKSVEALCGDGNSLSEEKPENIATEKPQLNSNSDDTGSKN